MDSAQRSRVFFGLYMDFVVGLGFMLMPMFILGIFGLSAGDAAWIRFVGMLASIIGAYCILAVRAGLDRFIPWSVPVRFHATAFMEAIVALGKTAPSLLLFAAIDAAAATWTLLAPREMGR